MKDKEENFFTVATTFSFGCLSIILMCGVPIIVGIKVLVWLYQLLFS